MLFCPNCYFSISFCIHSFFQRYKVLPRFNFVKNFYKQVPSWWWLEQPMSQPKRNKSTNDNFGPKWLRTPLNQLFFVHFVGINNFVGFSTILLLLSNFDYFIYNHLDLDFCVWFFIRLYVRSSIAADIPLI